MKKVYVGLELASRGCVATVIDTRGRKLETRRIQTGERELISFVKGIDAKVHLLMEEGELADWAWRTLREHAASVEIANPVMNAWIAKDPGKSDKVDSEKLAQLLRNNNYRPVHHLECLHMVHFKLMVKEHERLTKEVARAKTQLKAFYRTQGVIAAGNGPWGRDRDEYLAMLESHPRALAELELERLDYLERLKVKALARIRLMAADFPIVARLMKIPGCGLISAARLVAYIGNPHRFSSRRKLWSYSRLAVVHPETGGKAIGRERLDVRGCASLKDASRTIFNRACATKADNLIKRSYRKCLRSTGSDVHARLTCQRKILSIALAMWKNETEYDDSLT